MSPDIDEKAIRAERPEDMCLAIARAKADALLPKVEKQVLLVCMDQVTSCDGSIREKPESEKEARVFLESYRQGKPATFINGMVVHNTATGRQTVEFCAILQPLTRVSSLNLSKVQWKEFPNEVIDALVEKGEIFTCSGGVVVEDENLQKYQDSVEAWEFDNGRRGGLFFMFVALVAISFRNRSTAPWWTLPPEICCQGTLDSVQGLPVKPLSMLLSRAQAPAVTHVIFDMDGLFILSGPTSHSGQVEQEVHLGPEGQNDGEEGGLTLQAVPSEVNYRHDVLVVIALGL
eukprot:symbB.v1.2.031637.t1/scaffold3683.1/size52090/4